MAKFLAMIVIFGIVFICGLGLSVALFPGWLDETPKKDARKSAKR
jgi:hypothetical protein